MDPNHAFLVHKNQGMSLYLRGKVLVELVFVSDRQSFWTHQEMEDFSVVHRHAMSHLQHQASAAGVDLSLTTLQGQVTYEGALDPESFSLFYTTIRKQFLRQRNFASYDAYISARKRAYQVDEVAVIFVLEQRFRAFAHPSQEFEFCVVTPEDGAHVICHELLHLFGAVDLYYPYHIRGLTMKYFPKSIMCTSENMEVDPLTQYLVGWKTELPPKAKEFVEQASDHTVERYRAALELEYYRNRENELLEDAFPFACVSDMQRLCRVSCSPWAEFLLGLCYLHGIDVEKDLQKAEEHFARSGRTGLVLGAVAHAQMLLMRGISTPEDQETLIFLLEYNYSNHIKLTSLKLACRFKGIGLAKDPNLAAYHTDFYHKEWKEYLPYYQRSGSLYQIAARYSKKIPQLHRIVENMRIQYEQLLVSGDPDLLFLAAQLAEKKAKNNQDRFDAVVLYDQAARSGNYLACLEVARCYREGFGVNQDLDYARQWIEYTQQCLERNPLDAFCHIM